VLNTVMLASFSLLLASGQFLFKKVGLSVSGLGLTEALPLLLRSFTLYGALALYGGATLLWIWILSRVPLAQAYPWVAAGVVIVPVIGVTAFQEPVRPMFWVGVTLIMAGLLLTQLGAGER